MEANHRSPLELVGGEDDDPNWQPQFATPGSASGADYAFNIAHRQRGEGVWQR